MLVSDRPDKFPIPFANAAGAAYIRDIPTTSQIGIVDGAASLTDGFVPLNATPVGAGGVPPSIEDMNGILQQLSAWARWQAAGGSVYFDAAFAAAIGGYPLGASLQSTLSPDGYWVSLVNSNTVDPDAGPSANWRYMVQRVATGAEVLTRTANDRAITPLALAEASPFGSNANGYWEQSPNGFIEQWGRTPAISENGGAATYTFPVAFPNGCTSLQVSAVNQGASGGNSNDVWPQVVGYSSTQFTVMNQSPGTNGAAALRPIEWRAKGR